MEVNNEEFHKLCQKSIPFIEEIDDLTLVVLIYELRTFPEDKEILLEAQLEFKRRVNKY